jgi:hypothetical protein
MVGSEREGSIVVGSRDKCMKVKPLMSVGEQDLSKSPK